MSIHASQSRRFVQSIATAGVVALSLTITACGSESPTSVDGASTAAAGSTGSATTGGATGTTTGTGAAGATTAGRCNGTLAAITVDNVFVPRGATCTLAGTQVRGNVQVSIDGAIIANGARISGSVQAEDARSVVIAANTNIVGDVQVKRRATTRIEASTIRGNLHIEETGASVTASDSRVDGDVQVTKASSADLARLAVRGDVHLGENLGARRSDALTVGGNMQIEKNLGGVTLLGNRITQTLECKENIPAPTGSGNVANEKKEQCRAL